MITKSPVTPFLLFHSKVTSSIFFFDKTNFNNYCKILAIFSIVCDYKNNFFSKNQEFRFLCTQKLWSKGVVTRAKSTARLGKRVIFSNLNKSLPFVSFIYRQNCFYLKNIPCSDHYPSFHFFNTHNFNFSEKLKPLVSLFNTAKLVNFFFLWVIDFVNSNLSFRTFIFIYFVFLLKKYNLFIFLENTNKRFKMIFSGSNLRYSFSYDLIEYNWNLL